MCGLTVVVLDKGGCEECFRPRLCVCSVEVVWRQGKTKLSAKHKGRGTKSGRVCVVAPRRRPHRRVFCGHPTPTEVKSGRKRERAPSSFGRRRMCASRLADTPRRGVPVGAGPTSSQGGRDRVPVEPQPRIDHHLRSRSRSRYFRSKNEPPCTDSDKLNVGGPRRALLCLHDLPDDSD